MKGKLALKRTLELGKPRVLEVLVRQYGLVGGDSPVDSQALVEDADAAVGFRVVELVAFVLEDGALAQDSEAVRKAFGDKELPVVVFRELHRDALSVSGAAAAYVHCHIQNGAAYAPHQLALGEGRALEPTFPHQHITRLCFLVPGHP